MPPRVPGHGRQQFAHFTLVTVFLVLRHHGNKGLVEGAFGKQATQKIGNAIGKEEDVCGHPGTEQIGDDDIANQAHHAGYQRHSGHYHAGFDQFLTQDEGLWNCQNGKNAARIGRQFNRLPTDTPPGGGVYLHKSFDNMWLEGHISGPFQYTR